MACASWSTEHRPPAGHVARLGPSGRPGSWEARHRDTARAPQASRTDSGSRRGRRDGVHSGASSPVRLPAGAAGARPCGQDGRLHLGLFAWHPGLKPTRKPHEPCVWSRLSGRPKATCVRIVSCSLSQRSARHGWWMSEKRRARACPVAAATTESLAHRGTTSRRCGPGEHRAPGTRCDVRRGDRDGDVVGLRHMASASRKPTHTPSSRSARPTSCNHTSTRSRTRGLGASGSDRGCAVGL
jgi:hypothetical protein